MNKENPYEPSQLDAPTENGRSVLIFAAVSLAILTGASIWQNLVFVGIVAGVLFLCVLVCLANQSAAAEWKERWPAISEDEFLAKCAPGTDRETALKVRRIVADQLGIEYDRVHPGQSFVSDLGCD